MDSIKCRGHQRRIKILQQYEVIPKKHYVLLNGITRKSDADAPITHDYFIFICHPRGLSGGDKKICCGYGAARDFCNMLQVKLPPRFSMFRENSSNNSQGQCPSNSEEHSAKEKEELTPIARELCLSVDILMTIWNADVPTTTIFKVYDQIADIPFRKYLIKSVNTMIREGGNGKTLRQMILDLKQRNSLRDYSFPLLQEYLKNENIPSFF